VAPATRAPGFFGPLEPWPGSGRRLPRPRPPPWVPRARHSCTPEADPGERHLSSTPPGSSPIPQISKNPKEPRPAQVGTLLWFASQQGLAWPRGPVASYAEGQKFSRDGGAHQEARGEEEPGAGGAGGVSGDVPRGPRSGEGVQATQAYHPFPLWALPFPNSFTNYFSSSNSCSTPTPPLLTSAIRAPKARCSPPSSLPPPCLISSLMFSSSLVVTASSISALFHGMALQAEEMWAFLPSLYVLTGIAYETTRKCVSYLICTCIAF